MSRVADRAGHLAGRAAILLAALAFAALVLGPLTGRYRMLTVLTASMRPTYAPGSIVIAAPEPIDQIANGDVITYSIPVEDHRIVTHRVVEVVRPGVIRTRGDANNTDDPWIARLHGSTVWKVRGRVPLAGYLIQGARHLSFGAGAAVLATMVATLIGLRSIWRRPSLA